MMSRSSINWSSLNPRRLAPQIVDEEARSNPKRVLWELPVSSTSFEDGFNVYTYQDVSNAVNGLAHWLHDTLGPGVEFETLTYFGINDYMHMLLVLASIKVGYKMLYTPPRDNPYHQGLFLSSAGCRKILITDTVLVIDSIVQSFPDMQVIKLPKTSHFLHSSGTSFAHYPYEKTFDEAENDPFIVLSTSGTTGMPKPIIWTHNYIAKFAAERYMEPPAGYERIDEWVVGKRMYTLGPAPHASGVWTILVNPLYCHNVCILPPTGATLGARIGVEGAVASKADIAIFLPPFMEHLAYDSKLLQAMQASGTIIFYGGGAISRAAGEKISPLVKIFNRIGSTETGIWPCLRRKGEWDHRVWNSIHPNPGSGLELQEVGESLYEAVFVRQPGVSSVQPCFCIFPEAQTVRTGDLFKPANIPGYQGLWVHVGRSDDLQTFLNAAKFNPISTEHEILKNCQGSGLQDVLIACNNLPYAVLLFELSTVPDQSIDAQRSTFLEEYWPRIAEVNATIPYYAQLDKRRVVFTTSDRPMMKNTKGGIRRKLTLANYAQDFDRVIRVAGWTPETDMRIV